VAVSLMALALGACGGGSDGPEAAAAPPTELSEKAKAGKALFFDDNVPAQCAPGAE